MMINLTHTSRLLPQFSLGILSIVAVMLILIFNPITAFSDSDIQSIDAEINLKPYGDNQMELDLRFFDDKGRDVYRINYEIIVTQDGKKVFGGIVYDADGKVTHITDPLEPFSHIEITIKVNGLGLSTPYTGPTEELFFAKSILTHYFTAYSDKSSYSAGDAMRIYGHTSNDEYDNIVSLIIQSPSSDLVYIKQATVHNKEFSFDLIAGGEVWNESGNYVAAVTHGNSRAEVGFWFDEKTVISTTTTILVSADKTSYKEGDTIKISGKVTNPNSVSPVSLIVKAPNGNIVSISQLALSYDNTFSTTLTAGDALMNTSGTYLFVVQYTSEDISDNGNFYYFESEQPTYNLENTDSVAPLLLVPEDIIVNTQDSIVRVDYTVKAIDNVDGILQPVCNPSSGSYFGIGNTLVTCSAKDYSGNKVQKKFLVTVNGESENIPVWIKDVAGFWCSGEINDAGFIEGIQYLIENNVIIMPKTISNSGYSDQIPSWIKNNACWWSDGIISDSDFTSAIQYLISNGIIRVL